jgi:hypothetical protein
MLMILRRGFLMYAKTVTRIAFLLLLLFCSVVVSAQDVVFRWVDKHGVTHITDRLGDVPEPYHSMYAAQLRELEAKRKKTAPPQTTPDSTPNASNYNYGTGTVAAQDAQQKKWQALMLKWRAELLVATHQLFAAEEQLAQVRLNPILRETPQVKEQIAAFEADRSAALTRARVAENMLLVELPKQAKKEGVPPKWLL